VGRGRQNHSRQRESWKGRQAGRPIDGLMQEKLEEGRKRYAEAG
jgi:hypothetical protein